MALAQVSHRRLLIWEPLVTLFRVWSEAGSSARRYPTVAVDHGRSAVGQSEYWRYYFTGNLRRCWRGHTHRADWCYQK